MKNRMMTWAIAAALIVPVVGCAGATFSGLMTNIWRGFGLGIGFAPAELVVGLINDVIGTP